MANLNSSYRPFHSSGQFRLTDKSINENERDNFYTYFKEQIDIYGQSVDYYVHSYSLSAHDPVYGEQPTAVFNGPTAFVMFIEMSEDSVMLSQFGLQGEDTVTAYIPISAWYTKFGDQEEPKAGDVFKLSEYGNTRPGARDGKSFEITQRLDQEVSQINPLMGHYVWLVQAKRLDYSFEPGLTAEGGSDQVYDGSFSGRLSGYATPQTDTKVDVTNDVDTASKDVFDYDSFNDDDDVYGDYL